MVKEFDIEWSDFSGGHWFGNRDVKQPMNTYTGNNMIVGAADGFLMPGAPLVIDEDATSTATGTFGNGTVLDNGYLALNGAALTYGRRRTLTKPFVYDGTEYSSGSNNPRAWPVHFNGDVIQPYTTNRLAIFDVDTATLDVTTVTPDQFTGIYVWDAWAIGVVGNRLYFCAPYDATSWNSNDYIDVGDSDAVIQTIVPTVQGLLAGTATGWWQITGVLGQTTTKRQITTKGVAVAGGVDVDAGIFFMAGGNPDQASVRLLSGTQTPTALWDPLATFNGTDRIVRVGGHYVFAVTDTGGVIYMWSEHTRNWRRIQAFTADELSFLDDMVRYSVASDPGAGAAQAFIAARGQVAGPYDAVRIYTYDIDPFNPPVNAAGTAFTEATVDLAGYDHKRPFTVTEVLAELDCGTTSLNATRLCELTVKLPSPVSDFATDFAALAGQSAAARTFTLPSSVDTAGERPVVRFSPNDGGASMSVTPRVRLQGVKLRRLIMRCKEVA